ncbi:conserved Plasmodium membrane protein, unknown function [Plasmodium gonderi]|uniref:Uncharacterized protein n=1 Tax=Plasmodium gonderi TaxID=77519 RepID=A0A1Y1JH03_PLAGO|nr:conserved Plasmodium membrane protein, unknown function [Plasmodium gonderi]GAW79354.1 conserved Plasmodium membrane protein, unknown function [Plasmodium gonderi]
MVIENNIGKTIITFVEKYIPWLHIAHFFFSILLLNYLLICYLTPSFWYSHKGSELPSAETNSINFLHVKKQYEKFEHIGKYHGYVSSSISFAYIFFCLFFYFLKFVTLWNHHGDDANISRGGSVRRVRRVRRVRSDRSDRSDRSVGYATKKVKRDNGFYVTKGRDQVWITGSHFFLYIFLTTLVTRMGEGNHLYFLFILSICEINTPLMTLMNIIKAVKYGYKSAYLKKKNSEQSGRNKIKRRDLFLFFCYFVFARLSNKNSRRARGSSKDNNGCGNDRGERDGQGENTHENFLKKRKPQDVHNRNDSIGRSQKGRSVIPNESKKKVFIRSCFKWFLDWLGKCSHRMSTPFPSSLLGIEETSAERKVEPRETSKPVDSQIKMLNFGKHSRKGDCEWNHMNGRKNKSKVGITPDMNPEIDVIGKNLARTNMSNKNSSIRTQRNIRSEHFKTKCYDTLHNGEKKCEECACFTSRKNEVIFNKMRVSSGSLTDDRSTTEEEEYARVRRNANMYKNYYYEHFNKKSRNENEEGENDSGCDDISRNNFFSHVAKEKKEFRVIQVEAEEGADANDADEDEESNKGDNKNFNNSDNSSRGWSCFPNAYTEEDKDEVKANVDFTNDKVTKMKDKSSYTPVYYSPSIIKMNSERRRSSCHNSSGHDSLNEQPMCEKNYKHVHNIPIHEKEEKVCGGGEVVKKNDNFCCNYEKEKSKNVEKSGGCLTEKGIKGLINVTTVEVKSDDAISSSHGIICGKLDGGTDEWEGSEKPFLGNINVHRSGKIKNHSHHSSHPQYHPSRVRRKSIKRRVEEKMRNSLFCALNGKKGLLEETYLDYTDICSGHKNIELKKERGNSFEKKVNFFLSKLKRKMEICAFLNHIYKTILLTYILSLLLVKGILMYAILYSFLYVRLYSFLFPTIILSLMEICYFCLFHLYMQEYKTLTFFTSR